MSTTAASFCKSPNVQLSLSKVVDSLSNVVERVESLLKENIASVVSLSINSTLAPNCSLTSPLRVLITCISWYVVFVFL